jgi:hypothetical protein
VAGVAGAAAEAAAPAWGWGWEAGASCASKANEKRKIAKKIETRFMRVDLTLRFNARPMAANGTA